MAYDPILEAEIQQDQPITTDLLQKIKGNFEYLYSLIGSSGGGGGSSSGVPNGSFEIDEDADNIPDTWSRYLYAGGSGAYETAAPGHGAKAYKFTRALGTNNGGGYLTSDYIACAAGNPVVLSWLHKSSAAGLHNLVQILWYDKSQVYLSSSTIYDSTANPTSWTRFIRGATAAAGAYFFRMRVIGGYTDTDVAGDAWFDGCDRIGGVQKVVAYGVVGAIPGDRIHIDGVLASAEAGAGASNWGYGQRGVKTGVSGGRTVMVQTRNYATLVGELGIELPEGTWTIDASAHFIIDSGPNNHAVLTIVATREG